MLYQCSGHQGGLTQSVQLPCFSQPHCCGRITSQLQGHSHNCITTYEANTLRVCMTKFSYSLSLAMPEPFKKLATMELFPHHSAADMLRDLISWSLLFFFNSVGIYQFFFLKKCGTYRHLFYCSTPFQRFWHFLDLQHFSHLHWEANSGIRKLYSVTT